jgi:hypothetical protein
VYHENEDFFKIDQVGAQQRGDIVVSNPPFSRQKEVLRRLKDLGQPFVLILEDSVQATEYYHDIFGTDRPNVLSPQKRFGFVNEEGVQKGNPRTTPKYYFYKVPLPPDAQPKCVEREKAVSMEVEPVVGSGGSSSGGGSSAAATQAMPPPAPVSPAPALAPAAAQSPLEQQMAQMLAMMQQNQLDNQETKERLKAAEDRAKAAEEKAKAAEEKAKAATAKLDQVREKRKNNDRDDSSVTDSDKARTAGLLKGKKGVKPTPTATDKRNRD